MCQLALMTERKNPVLTSAFFAAADAPLSDIQVATNRPSKTFLSVRSNPAIRDFFVSWVRSLSFSWGSVLVDAGTGKSSKDVHS